MGRTAIKKRKPLQTRSSERRRNRAESEAARIFWGQVKAWSWRERLFFLFRPDEAIARTARKLEGGEV